MRGLFNEVIKILCSDNDPQGTAAGWCPGHYLRVGKWPRCYRAARGCTTNSALPLSGRPCVPSPSPTMLKRPTASDV